MTSHIKFRYDFEDESQHPYSVLYRMFKEFPTGILGIETYNKYGEIIKKHMHYHFVTDEKIESIRRRFTRSFAADKKPAYSLKEEKDIVMVGR